VDQLAEARRHNLAARSDSKAFSSSTSSSMAKKSSKTASSSASGVKPSSLSDATPRKPLIEISEEEQLRLIEQSGVLKKFKGATEGENSALVTEYIEEKLPLPEEIFNASLFIVPFSFLLLMMEMYDALIPLRYEWCQS
jgi:hypothetical protein